MQRVEIRQRAEDIMTGPIGSFLIRDTASHPGSFGVTVKVGEKQLKNFLLTRVRHEKGAHGFHTCAYCFELYVQDHPRARPFCWRMHAFIRCQGLGGCKSLAL